MIVVDTHIIIWNAMKPEMLSQKAEKALSFLLHDSKICFGKIVSLEKERFPGYFAQGISTAVAYI